MAIPRPASSSVEVGQEDSMGDNMTAGRRTPFEFASEQHLGTDISDERTTLLANGLDKAEVEDFSSLPWWKRPSVFWLLPPLLPFTLAFGGVAVPKINLLLTLICREYFSDRAEKDITFTYAPVIFGVENPQCRIPEVHALVSRFQLVMNLIAGILSAVVSPKLGELSDGYGRTKIIGLCTLGTCLGEVITALVATFPDTLPVNLFLLGAFFDGMFGSITAAVALTQSYAADCTPANKRNVSFGYFHGVLFIGIALGPLSASYLIKATGDVRLIFYAVVACQAILPIFISFIAPESLTKERQKRNREKRNIKPLDINKLRLQDFNPLHLLKPLAVLLPVTDKTVSKTAAEKTRVKLVQRNLIILAAIDTALFGVSMGTMSTLILYVEYVFGWGNIESSLFVSVSSTVRVIVLLGVLPLLTRWIRNRRNSSLSESQTNRGSDKLDIGIIRVSILFEFLGYAGFSLVKTGPLMVLCGVLNAMSAMASPTINSTLTKHLPSDRTGQLLGAVGLLHALARVIAPTVLGFVYSWTVGKLTQTVWILLASLLFVSFISCWFLLPHIYLPESMVEHSPSSDDTERSPDHLDERI
ncbi:hypothetical protein MGYG_07360 [Nannizzia gypsea CBS 118893]|uniref:Major facilitator superfamily (MFS) profile domain-containing protein n=1 Tax=Arthroderma gypseum (strain ATCC MYA-4604 / CBS 118893) TaxID=535722 RepID=E4V2X8_ARTGP|nr:hypothetical protein MGYG_07360 [Nannizzia gypsea CBS 118893]EFR04352.1 hypothetical protein MGYG_07360 [Nannizzia gypsea CBS 118893]